MFIGFTPCQVKTIMVWKDTAFEEHAMEQAHGEPGREAGRGCGVRRKNCRRLFSKLPLKPAANVLN